MNYIDTMKQALEALEGWRDNNFHKFCWPANFNRGQHAITALRLAIEQAEKQEPVGITDALCILTELHASPDLTREQSHALFVLMQAATLAAPPPQRSEDATQRQPLTEEKVKAIYAAMVTDARMGAFSAENWFQAGVAVAEAAHGIGGEA